MAGMTPILMEQIADLGALASSDLRARWVEAFGRPAPKKMSRDLLLRTLAYHVQEQADPRLAKATRRRLAGLVAVDGAPPKMPAPAPVKLKPGSRLIREWRGKVHQVTVCNQGFDYGGERYRSLSHVARTITGTRWSGPAFFGLKGRPGRSESHGL